MFGGTPPDIVNYLRMMQVAFDIDAANTQIIKPKIKHNRCLGCGKFMMLNDAFVTLMPMGYSHMIEGCLTNVVTKIRSKVESWDWNKYEQINPKPDVIMSAREDEDEERRSGIQSEDEGHREVQTEEAGLRAVRATDV